MVKKDKRTKYWAQANIGLLLNLFLYENHGRTKASIAEELGVNAIKVSRMLQKQGRLNNVSSEMAPVLDRYLDSLDLDGLRAEIDRLSAHREVRRNYVRAVFYNAEQAGQMDECAKAYKLGPEEFDRFAETVGVDSIDYKNSFVAAMNTASDLFKANMDGAICGRLYSLGFLSRSPDYGGLNSVQNGEGDTDEEST